MIYLFGSRSPACSKMPTIGSDIDIFVDDEDIPLIPREWLICNGGNVDAFETPRPDGWASPITDDPDDDRVLITHSRWGRLVDPAPISLVALTRLVEVVQHQIVKHA